MHARRKFESAAVDGAKAGKSLGEEGLQFFRRLYELEEDIKDKPPEERYQIRIEIALPIWIEMEQWKDRYKSKVPKQSKIGQALQYLDNQFEYLKGCLKDGRLNIDNAFTERSIRMFGIGRNNWLFSDTVAGAEASSPLYSLVVTAGLTASIPIEPSSRSVLMYRSQSLMKTTNGSLTSF